MSGIFIDICMDFMYGKGINVSCGWLPNQVCVLCGTLPPILGSLICLNFSQQYLLFALPPANDNQSLLTGIYQCLVETSFLLSRVRPSYVLDVPSSNWRTYRGGQSLLKKVLTLYDQRATLHIGQVASFVELWYNTTSHLSSQTTRFETMYGFAAPLHNGNDGQKW